MTEPIFTFIFIKIKYLSELWKYFILRMQIFVFSLTFKISLSISRIKCIFYFIRIEKIFKMYQRSANIDSVIMYLFFKLIKILHRNVSFMEYHVFLLHIMFDILKRKLP